MEAVNLIACEPFEQSVRDHLPRATKTFFGWLEDHYDAAVEVACAGEIFRGAEKHGGVAVVSARMHDTWLRGCVSEAACLVDRQGVHVGPQSYAPVMATLAMNDADDPGTTDTGLDFIDAVSPKLFGDETRGALFLEAKLWVRVEIVQDCSQCRRVFLDVVDDWHVISLFLIAVMDISAQSGLLQYSTVSPFARWGGDCNAYPSISTALPRGLTATAAKSCCGAKRARGCAHHLRLLCKKRL